LTSDRPRKLRAVVGAGTEWIIRFRKPVHEPGDNYTVISDVGLRFAR
jgi:hypothetical protein